MQSAEVTGREQIRTAVRAFIVETFLFGVDDANLTDQASFLETGIIDSTGILELVSFIESTYGFRVEDMEMTPDNLDSLSNIAAYTVRKLQGQ